MTGRRGAVGIREHGPASHESIEVRSVDAGAAAQHPVVEIVDGDEEDVGFPARGRFCGARQPCADEEGDDGEPATKAFRCDAMSLGRFQSLGDEPIQELSLQLSKMRLYSRCLDRGSPPAAGFLRIVL